MDYPQKGGGIIIDLSRNKEGKICYARLICLVFIKVFLFSCLFSIGIVWARDDTQLQNEFLNTNPPLNFEPFLFF